EVLFSRAATVPPAPSLLPDMSRCSIDMYTDPFPGGGHTQGRTSSANVPSQVVIAGPNVRPHIPCLRVVGRRSDVLHESRQTSMTGDPQSGFADVRADESGGDPRPDERLDEPGVGVRSERVE